MQAQLEHANFSVSDARRTAAWMEKLFGWKIRWQGEVLDGAGYSIHVGTDTQYVAIFSHRQVRDGSDDSYQTVGGLNHLAVTVEDLDAAEAAISAHGFETRNHADYPPGRRFYFEDDDGIEWEVVSYA